MSKGVLRSAAWGPPQAQACEDCGGARQMITGEVCDDTGTHAVFLAYLYTHGRVREVFLDLVLGPWDDDADPSHRLRFSTRTGPVHDGTIGSTLVDAAPPSADDTLLGTPVARAQGLTHPLLPTVWACSDSVLVDVPEVRAHLTARRRWRPPWR